nr:integrase, catalytic region, zinc finger, CCHC-type, peptidase aspartic, catalytic [Tanacetum cinerariifolium]
MFFTHSDEALKIEKLKRSRENKIEFAYDYGNLNANYVNKKINFKDDYFHDIINPDFENIDSPFQQTSSLKLYVPNVILEKIIIDLEDEVVNLLEKEKVNLETIESLKSKSFESSEKVSSESENQSENDRLVVEKECDKEENPKVIAPGMFKLNVSQCVSPISMSKSSCDSKNVLEKIIIDLEDEVVNLLEKEKVNLETIESLKSKSFESSEKENPKVIAPRMFKLNVSQSVLPILMTKSSCDSNIVEIKLKRKRHKRKSSKQDVKQVDNVVSRANSDFVQFLDLDTFSSVRRPKNNGVIWKKKWSSNISNVGLSAIIQICLWIIDSGCSKHMMGNRALLTNYVEKFLGTVRFGNNDFAIVQICLWIIDSGCSKHMMGNRALLTNYVKKFLGTVRFGNNDFAVIAGYGDVVIGSMTIKKFYYVEGLGHNLFSVGQFYDKGLEVSFRKFTCFVRNENGVDLLTGDRSSNLYTIALNKVASNSSTCLLAKAS